MYTCHAIHVAIRLYMFLVCLEAFDKSVQLQLCWIFLFKCFARSESWVGLLCSPQLVAIFTNIVFLTRAYSMIGLAGWINVVL